MYACIVYTFSPWHHAKWCSPTGCLHIVEQLVQVPKRSKRVKGLKWSGEKGHIGYFKWSAVSSTHRMSFPCHLSCLWGVCALSWAGSGGAHSSSPFTLQWKTMCGISSTFELWRLCACWCLSEHLTKLLLLYAPVHAVCGLYLYYRKDLLYKHIIRQIQRDTAQRCVSTTKYMQINHKAWKGGKVIAWMSTESKKKMQNRQKEMQNVQEQS